MIRRFVISLAVLVALAAGADYGLRLYSESVVAGELRSALALSEKPSVSFGGWPFVTHLVSGQLPSASFSASTFSSHGVRLHEVKVSLDDVHFPRRRLLLGGGGVIRASDGHGTVAMTGADITSTLHHAGAPLTVRISNGRASVTAQGITVGLDLKVTGDALSLAPASTTLGSKSFALPPVIKGLRYAGVTVRGTEAVLTVSVHHPVFVVPG